jgi:hypothetical protein
MILTKGVVDARNATARSRWQAEQGYRARGRSKRMIEEHRRKVYEKLGLIPPPAWRRRWLT